MQSRAGGGAEHGIAGMPAAAGSRLIKKSLERSLCVVCRGLNFFKNDSMFPSATDGLRMGKLRPKTVGSCFAGTPLLALCCRAVDEECVTRSCKPCGRHEALALGKNAKAGTQKAG
jgi:hypothetical protein